MKASLITLVHFPAHQVLPFLQGTSAQCGTGEVSLEGSRELPFNFGVQGMWVPVGRLPVTNSILVHLMWKECALVGSGLDGQGDPETLLTSILP